MSGAVDSTGHSWFPRRGDAVRDLCTLRCGVVVGVRQHASAPAIVTVCLEPDDGEAGAGDWQVFERDVEQLELDTSDDVELPSFEERRATMAPDEAAAIITGALVELASYRARVSADEELVAVLEAETHRALLLARAHTESGRYDLALREREIAAHLRDLACAIAVQLAARPSCG